MLIINDLKAGYTKENPILKGINLNIKDGEVIGILGRNGSGKSTLVKAICGLVPYCEGEIFLDGKLISGLPTFKISRLGIGLFQQGGRVFPNLTVKENIDFTASTRSNNEKNKKIGEISYQFEVLSKLNRLKLKSSYLSGGEKNQLALAMILINKPKMLIFDEPSAGLSPSNTRAMYEVILKFREKNQTTILFIEQNVEIAVKNCNYIYQLSNGIISEAGNKLNEGLEKTKRRGI